MSLHQTDGNNKPSRLLIRTSLIEVLVVFTVLLVSLAWMSASLSAHRLPYIFFLTRNRGTYFVGVFIILS